MKMYKSISNWYAKRGDVPEFVGRLNTGNFDIKLLPRTRFRYLHRKTLDTRLNKHHFFLWLEDQEEVCPYRVAAICEYLYTQGFDLFTMDIGELQHKELAQVYDHWGYCNSWGISDD